MHRNIDALRDDPRPPGSEKLSAQERYRVCQGSYRILYEIEDRYRDDGWGRGSCL
jgi:mRNA-degrading endonuclease RelE of RelBE toxin-antitoxin system